MSPYIAPLAYVAGQAAPALVQQAGNAIRSYFDPRPMPQSNVIVQRVQPAPRRRQAQRAQRGRGSRRGGQSNRSVPQAMQPARGVAANRFGVTLRDTEVIASAKATLQVIEFCPGKTGLTRLDAEASKFTRYQFHSAQVAFKATASTTTSGQITFGILPGAKNDNIKTAGDIMKLRPFRVGAVWKSDSISVPRNVTPQNYLYTNGTGDDDVAFCIYIYNSEGSGTFAITYNLTLSYPNP